MWRGKGRTLFAALVVALAVGAPGPLATADGVLQRPISDFVDVQTTADVVDWVSGEPDNIEYTARIDYLGAIDRFFGGPFETTFDGHITERVRPDGKTEVHVVIHTKHAFGVVCAGTVLSPATTVWSRLAGFALPRGLSVDFCDMDVDLTYASNDPPGSPMPHFRQLLYSPRADQEVLQVQVRGTGDGELRAAFGVEDGTPGRMVINQKGIFNAAFEGGITDWEPFPAAVIDLHPIGK